MWPRGGHFGFQLGLWGAFQGRSCGKLLHSNEGRYLDGIYHPAGGGNSSWPALVMPSQIHSAQLFTEQVTPQDLESFKPRKWLISGILFEFYRSPPNLKLLGETFPFISPRSESLEEWEKVLNFIWLESDGVVTGPLWQPPEGWIWYRVAALVGGLRDHRRRWKNRMSSKVGEISKATCLICSSISNLILGV